MQKTQDLAEGDLLVSREVMDIARISRRTLERWVSTGKLPVVRIEGFSARRYRRRDLNSLLSPQSTPAVPAPTLTAGVPSPAVTS